MRTAGFASVCRFANTRTVTPATPRLRLLLHTTRTLPITRPIELCATQIRSASTLGEPQDLNQKNKTKMAPTKLELKTPKGTRDWDGDAIVLREQIFNTSMLLSVKERNP